MATQTEVPRTRALEAAAPPVSPSRLRDVAVIGVPAVVALALCLIELTTRSLWLDEAATVAIAGQHGSAFWHAAAHDGGNMLGYYALLHVLVGWFGDGAVVIRLPSAIASGAAAGAVALLGLRLFDRRVALAAGLLDPRSASHWCSGVRTRGDTPRWWRWSRGRSSPSPRSWTNRAGEARGSPHRPDHAVGVRELRRDLRAARAAARARVATDGVAPGALGDGGVRGVLDPARGARARRGSGQLFWIGRPNFKLERQVIGALTLAGFEPNFRPTVVGAPLAILTLALLVFAATRIVRRPIGER